MVYYSTHDCAFAIRALLSWQTICPKSSPKMRTKTAQSCPEGGLTTNTRTLPDMRPATVPTMVPATPPSNVSECQIAKNIAPAVTPPPPPPPHHHHQHQKQQQHTQRQQQQQHRQHLWAKQMQALSWSSTPNNKHAQTSA